MYFTSISVSCICSGYSRGHKHQHCLIFILIYTVGRDSLTKTGIYSINHDCYVCMLLTAAFVCTFSKVHKSKPSGNFSTQVVPKHIFHVYLDVYFCAFCNSNNFYQQRLDFVYIRLHCIEPKITKLAFLFKLYIFMY